MIIRQSAIPRSLYILWIAASRATAVGLLLAADRDCSPIRPMPRPIFCREPFIEPKRQNFHPEAFLARYQRHNAEVMEHFAGRDNLLVMDMDSQAGWKLCRFLGCEEPRQPYPFANGPLREPQNPV
jgi:hypothetical protein